MPAMSESEQLESRRPAVHTVADPDQEINGGGGGGGGALKNV